MDSLYSYQIQEDWKKKLYYREFILLAVFYSGPLMMPVAENLFTVSELKPTSLFNPYLLT